MGGHDTAPALSKRGGGGAFDEFLPHTKPIKSAVKEVEISKREIDVLQQEVVKLRGAIQELIRAKRDFEADVSMGVIPDVAKSCYDNRMDKIMGDLDRIGAKYK